jgi:hypothetical protein
VMSRKMSDLSDTNSVLLRHLIGLWVTYPRVSEFNLWLSKARFTALKSNLGVLINNKCLSVN